MIELGRTPRGYTIFVEKNELNANRYWSDEIGGGVMVWDTCLVSEESLEFALAHERKERRGIFPARPRPLWAWLLALAGVAFIGYIIFLIENMRAG